MSLFKQILTAVPSAPSSPVTPVYEWREKTEAARRERRPRELVERAGWPERAVTAASSADEAKPCIRAAVGWDPGGGCLLVLSSQPGAGKTVAAAWWAIRQPKLVEFVTAAEFVRASGFDGGRDRWLGAEALVLDDLGAEYQDAKGASSAALDDLVNEFYSHCRPLVITTNLDAGEFKARCGERIADRVRECRGWRAIANAPSLRGAR